jgi:hypothetical protein
MAGIITIDADSRDTVRLTVSIDGAPVHEESLPWRGAVDNRLLTAIDSLFKKNILDRFAPITVKAGPGVDTTSILYRIVVTLDRALSRTGAQNS